MSCCSWDSKLKALALQLAVIIKTKTRGPLLASAVFFSRCQLACNLDTRKFHRWFRGLQRPWCLLLSAPVYPSVTEAEKLDWTAFLQRRAGRRSLLEGPGASWRKLLIKRTGEPVGCLTKQGAPGLHKRGLGIHHHSPALYGKGYSVCSSAMPRCTLSLRRDVKYSCSQAPPPPCALSWLERSITEGDVIAWHDEIVHVKVHFIQSKCVEMQMGKGETAVYKQAECNVRARLIRTFGWNYGTMGHCNKTNVTFAQLHYWF